MSTTSSSARTLLLIPGLCHPNGREEARLDRSPLPDYLALQAELNADILDYGALDSEHRPALVQLARRAGKDAALAALGYSYRSDYDIIFSNGENVGIPLALLLARHRRRPGHIVIGHRLSAPKKRPFLRLLHPLMDALFVYATRQYRYAVESLHIPAEKLVQIPFHADHRFFRPLPAASDAPSRIISSAGLEWRDYPTLIAATTNMDATVKLAAASPWSRHRDVTQDRPLPTNITARRYAYPELRQLYADSRIVVVPLRPTDFQAGITTILEGMAMGKAVVTSRTVGQTDAIRDGANGLYVPPEDTEALRRILERLLNSPEETERLGQQARRDIEAKYTLDHWVANIARVHDDVFRKRRSLSNT